MKCPACSNELTSADAGGVTLEICKSSCGGIWFDEHELRNFDEVEEQIAKDILRAIPNSIAVIDQSRDRLCPKCPRTPLSRTFSDNQYNIEIDQCPRCSGTWLDLGELQMIREQTKVAHERDEVFSNFMKKHAQAAKEGRLPKSIQAVFKLVF